MERLLIMGPTRAWAERLAIGTLALGLSYLPLGHDDLPERLFHWTIYGIGIFVLVSSTVIYGLQISIGRKKDRIEDYERYQDHN